MYGSFLCTFCKKRDKFRLTIPNKMAATLDVGQCYDVDFDVMTNGMYGVANNFSFNFINPTKDNSHE